MADIQVNIKAEEPFIFDFVILRDHQDVLLRDQMLDCVRNLLGLHRSPLYRSTHPLIQCHLLHYVVDEFALLRGLLAFSLKLLDLADD